jgi:hypothetical protein
MLAAGLAVPASRAMRWQDSSDRLASVELVSCSAARHRAVFEGRMTSVPQTERMAMRFKLLERSSDGSWVPVRSRKLARWHSSLPGVQTFVYRQKVRRLPVGSAFRALVRFRWYSQSGEVIRRARHRSRSCRIYGPRPNLRVLRIRQLSVWGGGRSASYAVRVGNRGVAPARSAEVTLFVDGAAVGAVDAGRLEPGDSRRVTFNGPNCSRPDSPVSAVVDPNHRVPESHERDNRLSNICAAIR